MAMQPPQSGSVEQVAPGDCATGYEHTDGRITVTDAAPKPGDFILTHGGEWTQLIRFGQSLRYRGESAKYTHWNHTALVVDRDGAIVEALGTGVAQRSIHDYTPRNTRWFVSTRRTRIERRPRCSRRSASGAAYGWLTIASIAFSLVTGGKVAFAIDGQLICSGLVARSLERTTAIFKHNPARIMPAELAEIYQVVPPAASTPKGVPPGRKRS